MLTEAQENEIYRVWGYTTVARELIRMGMSQGKFLELKTQYKAVHIIGPFWSKQESVWKVKQSFATGPGKINTATILSATLKRFLNVQKTERSFTAFRC